VVLAKIQELYGKDRGHATPLLSKKELGITSKSGK
jgi:hypothetical protein